MFGSAGRWGWFRIVGDHQGIRGGRGGINGNPPIIKRDTSSHFGSQRRRSAWSAPVPARVRTPQEGRMGKIGDEKRWGWVHSIQPEQGTAQLQSHEGIAIFSWPIRSGRRIRHPPA